MTSISEELGYIIEALKKKIILILGIIIVVFCVFIFPLLNPCLLLSIDAESEDELNSGIIFTELTEALKTEGFALSENAVVTKQKEGVWAITGEEKFIVKKEDGELNIYTVRKSLLDLILVKIKQDQLPKGAKLIYISPVEVLMLKMKLGLLAGILSAAPVAGYYAHKTLKKRFRITVPMKKSHTVILLTSTIALFIAGMSYAYFLMLPLVLNYLYYMSSSAGVAATYSIHEFVFFIAVLTLILGISFEIPVVIVFAVHSGLIRVSTLRKYRRYIIVAMFVLAAVFTPPEVLSQLIVACPMVIFYELGILAASVISKRDTTVKHPLRAQD